jgi:hypothetical protein
VSEFDEQEWRNDGCPTLESLHPEYVKLKHLAVARYEELSSQAQAVENMRMRAEWLLHRAKADGMVVASEVEQVLEMAPPRPFLSIWKRAEQAEKALAQAKERIGELEARPTVCSACRDDWSYAYQPGGSEYKELADHWQAEIEAHKRTQTRAEAAEATLAKVREISERYENDGPMNIGAVTAIEMVRALLDAKGGE